MTKRVTIAVALPGGSATKDGSDVFVNDDGCALVVRVRWPAMLTDLNKLHSKWRHLKIPAENRIPDYHPKLIAFKEHYRQLKKREKEPIFSVAHIPLPFQVQQRIVELHRFGDQDGARILYVELKAFDNNYEDVSDNEEFELFDWGV